MKEIVNAIKRRKRIRKFLQQRYELCIGKQLHFLNPKSFNAKIQWLKINYYNYLYVVCADKLLLRNYVKKKGFETHFFPRLYGVYDDVESIDFGSLPNKFVIKCTHGSGYVVLCHDKQSLNIKNTTKKLNIWMKTNYTEDTQSGEWSYDVLSPKIIIEEFLQNDDNSEIVDYKFMCFNGEPKMLFLTYDRGENKRLKVDFYDLEWNKLTFERHYKNSKHLPTKPQKLLEMIETARILAQDFPFVRVDLYLVNNKIYIGELTFYPGGGWEEFEPQQYDYELGNLLILPSRFECIKEQIKLYKFIKYYRSNPRKYLKIQCEENLYV